MFCCSTLSLFELFKYIFLLHEIYVHRWLRQPFHLQSLLLFLNDIDLQVKIIATSVLGKQAYLNPGFLMPKLRLHFRHLIVDLQLHQDINAKEEAAKLLCEFIKSSSLSKLVRPLTHTLVKAIPLQHISTSSTFSNHHPHHHHTSTLTINQSSTMSSNSNRLTTVGLELLGELCLVDDLSAYLPDLFPVILTAMQDKSSSRKREVILFIPLT